jgi:hypothetical protein
LIRQLASGPSRRSVFSSLRSRRKLRRRPRRSAVWPRRPQLRRRLRRRLLMKLRSKPPRTPQRKPPRLRPSQRRQSRARRQLPRLLLPRPPRLLARRTASKRFLSALASPVSPANPACNHLPELPRAATGEQQNLPKSNRVAVVADTLLGVLAVALLLVEAVTMVAANPAAMVFRPQHNQPSRLVRRNLHQRPTKMDGQQLQFPAKVVAVAVQ